MKQKEHRLQVNCVEWFRLQYPRYSKLLRAIPNGGSRGAGKMRIITGRNLKVEGVQRGTADLILFVARGGWHSLHIEMKTTDKGSRQSVEQKEYEKAVTAEGNRYEICRTLEEFIRLINGYLK